MIECSCLPKQNATKEKVVKHEPRNRSGLDSPGNVSLPIRPGCRASSARSTPGSIAGITGVALVTPGGYLRAFRAGGVARNVPNPRTFMENFFMENFWILFDF